MISTQKDYHPMRKLLAATTLVLAMAAPAHAHLILFDNPNQPNSGDAVSQSFVDFGAQGFGNSPAALTLQSNGSQIGSVTPSITGTAVVHDQAIAGSNKAATPTLTDLGWLGGSVVAIGYNSNQSNQTGITLQQLALTVYSGTTALASFSLATNLIPLQFTAADLQLQEGHGNAIFGFVLDTQERAQFNALVALTGSGDFRVGLAANMGCFGAAGNDPNCQVSNDGADTFYLIARGNPIINPTCPDCVINPVDVVPGPVAGAGLPGLFAACVGLWGWRRRRHAPVA